MADNVTHIGQPASFHKVCRLGTAETYGGRRFSVFVSVRYTADHGEHGRLSITGVGGPLESGNALGGCDQCLDMLDTLQTFAPGWTRDKVKLLASVWRQWHLNDMRAGSPRQREFLRVHPPAREPLAQFETTREHLTAAGLEPDSEYLHNGRPYRYGSAWLSEPVPVDALAWLQSLPDADKRPAWI